MPRLDKRQSEKELEKLLGEASWLLSHAQALADYGRQREAATEWARAANCEEEAACLLDAAGREDEAVVHRVSAASCREHLGEYARSVTLLRAALSGHLTGDYERSIQRQLAACLKLARPARAPLAAQTPGHAVAVA